MNNLCRSSVFLLLATFAASAPVAAQGHSGQAACAADLVIQPPGPEYGAELKAEALKIGPIMDVAVADDWVHAIGKERLVVLAGARTGKLLRVGALAGLGNVRQIAVAGWETRRISSSHVMPRESSSTRTGSQ